jgi:hypothetical protein
MPEQIKKGQHPPVDEPAVELEKQRREERDTARQADPQPGGGRPSESEKPDSPDSRWGSGDRR